MTESLLAGAYWRLLPGLLLRRAGAVLSLSILPVSVLACWLLGVPWWAWIPALLTAFTAAGAGVLFMLGPTRALEATVTSPYPIGQGVFDAEQRARWRDKHWLQLPGGAFSVEEFAGRAAAVPVSVNQVETALVLLRDGWTGSAGELLETARLLEQG